jgi:hypothetical protein
LQGSECNAKGLSSWSKVATPMYCHEKDMKRVNCDDNVQGCTYIGLMSEASDKYARTTDSGCSGNDQFEVHVKLAKGGPMKRPEDNAILCVYLPYRKLQCWCSGIGCDKKFALTVCAG